MSILAIAELREGEFRKVSYEVITFAKQLAGKLGVGFSTVVLGSNVSEEKIKALGSYGAEKIEVVDHPHLANYDGSSYAKVIQQLLAQKGAKVAILSHSAQGKDLAPRVSALTAMAYLPDLTAVEIVDGKVQASRPLFAGKVMAKVRPKTDNGCVLTLRPNIFSAVKLATPANATIEKSGLTPETPKAPVKEILKGAEKKLDLTEAEIIVSGGRGLKAPENFEVLLYPLAAQLGAAVGASRAVVDAGWRPHGDQVGQTGKTVTPNLYFAIGISGAIQHLAGMSSSKCIVAINKDKDAPIFQVADYGLVGDLFEVVPALTEAIKKVKEA